MNRSAMRSFRQIFPAFLVAIALPLASAGCRQSAAPAERPPLEGAALGGPFTLADKAGKVVRWSDFAGRYRAVYFGYTFCPDVCPLDVQSLMRGYARFERVSPARAARLQPMFITIDPARDTPAAVGEFAAAFSPKLLGLTGTAAQIADAAKMFAVYYARGNQTAGGYLMDHSRIAYLMGPRGEPIVILPVDKGPDAVAEELEKWVK